MLTSLLDLVPARRLRLAGLCLLLSGACMRGEGAFSPVGPGGVLAPQGEPSEATDGGAFRVVFSAPEGHAADASEISIVFSRPLRALDQDAPPPPLKMSPALAGSFRWVGSRALRFVPESLGSLPGATRVTLEVPAETRALDGTRLGTPHRFSFETPRPKLVDYSPSGGGHTPGTTIELFFNQPVELAEVSRRLELSAEKRGAKRSLAFRVERPDERDPKRARIVPEAPLPLASSIRGVLGAGLSSREGPLPSETPQPFELSTYGPLEVERLDCWPNRSNCAAWSAPTLELTNAVRWSELKRTLSVTPALPLRWESWQADEELTTNFSIPARFEPGKAYQVTLAGDLRDRFGQTLGKPAVSSFRMADLDPLVEIGVEGANLPAGSAASVPIGAVNLAAYELVLAPLRPEHLLGVVEARGDADRLAALLATGAAERRTISARGAKNRIERHDVALASLLSGGLGVAGIAVRPHGGSREAARARLVKVSDLAITAKIAPAGSLVWVTRLSSGRPVADAEVELRKRGQPTRSYRTDSRGLAAIPRGELVLDTDGWDLRDEAILIARSGRDLSYEAVSDHLPAWRLPIAVDFSAQNRVYGMLFSDRGIYRPGDELSLKGIVRVEARGGNQVTAGRPLEVVISGPNGDPLETRRVVTGDFGTFSFSTRVPASAGLGNFEVTVRAPGNGDRGPVANYSFHVAEYRPNEFRVEVDAAPRQVRRGEKLAFEVRGDYLYGAPMAGAGLSYGLSRGPAAFELPGHEGYVTDAGSYYADFTHASLDHALLASGSAELDARGRFALERPAELPGQRGPELVLLSAEVTDPARQAVAGQASALVHPADFYLGIARPSEWFVTTPATYSPRVVAVAPAGTRLAGKRVRLELLQRRFTLAREVTEGRAAHAVSRPVDRVVASCELSTKAEPVSCALELKEGGYYLVVARAVDERKNEVEAALGLYALGNAAVGWGDGDRASVELVPNKTAYRVGETAKILVKSPFPETEALITVEREGVYRTEQQTLRGSLPTVSVPITEDLRPNAYVAVHLLRARTAGRSEEKLGASYRMGYLALAIDPGARRLNVAVKPSRRDAKPGSTLDVDLAVTNSAGKGQPAELSVFAVDEGVLALTGYRTPDPLPVFSAARPLAVATLETREALAKVGLELLENLLGLDKGRDGGGGGQSARSDFRQTAFFEPALATDGQGRARASFKLPDSLTSYRVMAVAVTKGDQYGFGAQTVTVSKKLMARTALPRFLRKGDVAEAGVVVAKKGLGPGKVRVTAEVSGLELDGPASRDAEVDRDGSLEVRFRLRAARAGEAVLRFTVEGGGEQDIVEVKRRVDAPKALEAVALYGETDARAAERLGSLSGLDQDAGGLELRLSSSALVGLDLALETLLHYPYGCTEQLASQLLPLLPLAELARDYGLRLPPNVRAASEGVIGTILERQSHDGGFGFWPGSPTRSLWLSGYVTWVLEEARRRGAHVPQSALDRAVAFLREELGRSFDQDLPTAAFVVHVLALIGKPDAGYASRLLEVHERLPLFAKALLLHALAAANSGDPGRAALARSVENRLRVAGDAAYASENVGSEYAPLMDSPVRTSAIVLRSLVAHDPKHALLTPLARGLIAARRGGAYRTTQESAYALLALDEYRRVRETRSPNFEGRALLGERELAKLGAAGRSLVRAEGFLTMSELKATQGSLLTFEKRGSGRLHYEARLRYAPARLPETALDRGYFVRKTLRAVEPAQVRSLSRAVPETSSSRFSAGGLVVTDLLVVTPSPREYLVLDDPLPAGFEAVDTALATTSSLYSGDGACDGCDLGAETRSGYGSAWFRRELRDDRALFFVDHLPAGIYHYRYLARATTPGRFIVPPTRAEGMYEPETFGRTAAGVVEIR